MPLTDDEILKLQEFEVILENERRLKRTLLASLNLIEDFDMQLEYLNDWLFQYEGMKENKQIEKKRLKIKKNKKKSKKK